MLDTAELFGSRRFAVMADFSSHRWWRYRPDCLHLCGGAFEQEAVNLVEDRESVVKTGCNQWKHGLDVLVDMAQLADRHARVRRLADWRPSNTEAAGDRQRVF